MQGMDGQAGRGGAGAVLTVDLGAAAANYRLLRARLGRTRCGAVLKADGYGVGAARLAPALFAEGCRHFFVAHLDEGIALRTHLADPAVIHVMHGVFAGWEAECVEHGLTPVLNSEAQVRRWAALGARLGRPLPAAMQIDTGMSRFGLSAAELASVVRDAHPLCAVDLRLVMSHLACADTPAHPANELQRQAFDGLRRVLPASPASLAASSGIFLQDAFHYDLARPGAALFGIAPAPGTRNPLYPVVRLDARVVQIRDVPAGTAIGYGHAARTAKPSRLATVAVGYADGYFRSGSGQGAAWFGDAALPVLGRVSMDSIVLDASAAPDGALHEGSLVELIGPHRNLDAVAADMGTIGYEILTALGHRYQRRFITDGDDGGEP